MTALWDADPDVCCAAFQLGACAHTESFDYDAPDYQAGLDAYHDHLAGQHPADPPDDEPF
jgi:hypothetical protein